MARNRICEIATTGSQRNEVLEKLLLQPDSLRHEVANSCPSQQIARPPNGQIQLVREGDSTQVKTTDRALSCNFLFVGYAANSNLGRCRVRRYLVSRSLFFNAIIYLDDGILLGQKKRGQWSINIPPSTLLSVRTRRKLNPMLSTLAHQLCQCMKTMQML